MIPPRAVLEVLPFDSARAQHVADVIDIHIALLQSFFYMCCINHDAGIKALSNRFLRHHRGKRMIHHAPSLRKPQVSSRDRDTNLGPRGGPLPIDGRWPRREARRPLIFARKRSGRRWRVGIASYGTAVYTRTLRLRVTCRRRGRCFIRCTVTPGGTPASTHHRPR